jgi:hypothetical protein
MGESVRDDPGRNPGDGSLGRYDHEPINAGGRKSMDAPSAIQRR